MESMWHELIRTNYPILVILAFMIVFLITDSITGKKVNRIFGLSLVLMAIDLAAFSVEAWTKTLAHPVLLRTVCAALGYTSRVSIAYLMIIIVRRDNSLKKATNILLLIPLIFNTIVAFSAFFTDIGYSFDANNQFVRGPLGYTTHIVSFIYLIILAVLNVDFFIKKNYSEAILIVMIASLETVGIVMETFYGYPGTVRVTYALSLVFYYMYFNVQDFKRDVLTGAYNRRCFYSDSEKYGNSVRAVVSIDLNNLKQLNDSLGHAKGDEALCTLVNTVNKVLPGGCSLYRTGGDEFMIMCVGSAGEDKINKMIAQIRSGMSEAELSCAIGVAWADSGYNDFDEMCSRADAEMYRDKQRIKGAGIAR